MLVVT